MSGPGDDAVRPPEDDGYLDDLLELVDGVPPGRATTYGALADALGRGGARKVGAAMSRHGSLTTWWRVVNASGSLPDHLADEALAAWREEGTPLRSTSPPRVDLARAWWQPHP